MDRPRCDECGLHEKPCNVVRSLGFPWVVIEVPISLTESFEVVRLLILRTA
jgi:hypothetical protein